MPYRRAGLKSKPFKATYCSNGKVHYIGYFATHQEALEARRRAKARDPTTHTKKIGRPKKTISTTAEQPSRPKPKAKVNTEISITDTNNAPKDLLGRDKIWDADKEEWCIANGPQHEQAPTIDDAPEDLVSMLVQKRPYERGQIDGHDTESESAESNVAVGGMMSRDGVNALHAWMNAWEKNRKAAESIREFICSKGISGAEHLISTLEEASTLSKDIVKHLSRN
jgi:hypothetical protein